MGIDLLGALNTYINVTNKRYNCQIVHIEHFINEMD